MNTKDSVRRLDKTFPSFFSEYKKKLNSFDSKYAQYRLTEQFFRKQLIEGSKRGTSYTEDDLIIYDCLQNYLTYMVEDCRHLQVSTFSELLNLVTEEIGNDALVAFNATPLLVYQEMIEKEENGVAELSEMTKFDITNPAKPVLNYLYSYYYGLLHICYALTHIDNAEIAKSRMIGNAIEVFDIIFEHGRFIVNGQHINIEDCFVIKIITRRKSTVVPAKSNSEEISNIIFEFLSTRMLYILYDYFLIDRNDKQRLLDFIKHTFYNLSLHAFRGTQCAVTDSPAAKLWNVIMNGDSNDVILKGTVEEIKTAICYNDVKDLTINELCERIDGKIKAFFEEFCFEKDLEIIRHNLQGFLTEIDDVFIGGKSALDRLSTKDFLLDKVILADGYESDCSHSKNSNVRIGTEAIEDVVLREPYADAYIDDMDYNHLLVSDFPQPSLDYTVHLLDEADSTNPISIVDRGELYSEAVTTDDYS